jgi:acetyl esterase/lipase
MARNVVVPTLTLHRPEGKSNGAAMIVAPGGAFHFLMMDKEGHDLARWLSGKGITAFVLKYRLARTPDEDSEMPSFVEDLVRRLPHPTREEVNPPVGTRETEAARLLAEEDGLQAIRFVRRQAARWSLDPQMVGIGGFSAGGGVAVNAALQRDEKARPNFVAGIYPGYRPLGETPRSLPPLFLAVADDDLAVAPISVIRLYEGWRKAGGAAELHVFADGKHGFGVKREGVLANQWTGLFDRWLHSCGLI